MILWVAVLIALMATCNIVRAANTFYVAVNGTAANDGTPERPWDLVTALNHPTAVKPGDTIFIRGGVYSKTGTWTPKLVGSLTTPIIVKATPYERVQVTGSWQINGSDTWYWGLEHTYLGNESRISVVAN